MKNKVVLIKPENTVTRDVGTPLPLSILSLASVLEQEGFQVKIIDSMAEKNHLKLIEKEIKDAFLVGITAMTSEIKSAIEIMQLIKKIPNVPVVMGGWHVTLFPIQVCSDPLVDFAVMNEGEIAITELAKALKSGKSYKKIRGLVYKEKGQVKINPFDYLDLDKLPLPAYHLVDMEKYISKTRTRRWLTYQTSRGCPHRCAFCINHVTKNNRYRAKSPEKVIEELKFLIPKYNISGLVIVDDNFFVQRERVKKICEGMIKEGFKVKWRGECRADYFKPGFVDDELLNLATKSGLFELTIGAESGSQKMLNFMCKDITVKQILDSARICKKHNIIPQYPFIVGLPNETKEDVLLSLKLIRKLLKINPNLLGGMGTYRPYPKDGITTMLIEQGKFKEPKTLREWSSEKYIQIYTSDILAKSWQFSPSFLENVCLYVTRALNLNRKLQNFNIRETLEIPFALLFYLRLKIGFFFLSLDKYAYRLYQRVRKYLYKKFIRR